MWIFLQKTYLWRSTKEVWSKFFIFQNFIQLFCSIFSKLKLNPIIFLPEEQWIILFQYSQASTEQIKSSFIIDIECFSRQNCFHIRFFRHDTENIREPPQKLYPKRYTSKQLLFQPLVWLCTALFWSALLCFMDVCNFDSTKWFSSNSDIYVGFHCRCVVLQFPHHYYCRFDSVYMRSIGDQMMFFCGWVDSFSKSRLSTKKKHYFRIKSHNFPSRPIE